VGPRSSISRPCGSSPDERTDARVQQLVSFHVQSGGMKLLFGLSVRNVARGTPRLHRRIEMVSSGLKSVFGACIAGSLMFSSTAALASAPAPQVDPWAVLTAMSGGAPAAAMCGSAAAVAAAAAATQAPGGCVLPVVDAVPPPPVASAAPPPPPLVAESAGAGISPLVLGLLAVAAGVGLYFAVHSGGHHANSPA
jgi:hypothetical protein